MVLVLAKNGKPLDPTVRCGHVRHLLKNKLARIVSTKPFVIQLKYEVKAPNKTQKYVLGISSGRTNIGFAVVNKKNVAVLAAEVTTRNKEIPKLMTTRRMFRENRRTHVRREKRRRRARAAGTTKTEPFQRVLPGCKTPIVCKDIKNKEARFNNRARPNGWLTPTANQLLLTYINMVKQILKWVPISKIKFEQNIFHMPVYSRLEFQPGQCILCGEQTGVQHHIVHRAQFGSNSSANLASLCPRCHRLVHTDETTYEKLSTLTDGTPTKGSSFSLVAQIIPRLLAELCCFSPVTVVNASKIRAMAKRLALESVPVDRAYCAAVCSRTNVKPVFGRVYKVYQFRRHNRKACVRAMTDRKYYLDGVLVATNRYKAIGQFTDSLKEFRALYADHNKRDISRLAIKEHHPQYYKPGRIMPGAVIDKNGERFVLKANAGKSYIDTEGVSYGIKNCKVIQYNKGLVWT